MSTKIAGRKSKLSRVGFTLALILLLSSFALPGNAAPSQDLSFHIQVTYYAINVSPTYEGFGTWSSTGLFTDAGDIYETEHSSGWDGCWRAAHTTSVLTGANPEDTITIRTQIVRVEAEPYCATFLAEGNWVILSATGAYAGLHGQGNAAISGGLQPGQVGFDLVVHSELQGRGH
ncbi:MAG: hypothetical protein KAX65_01685 [Caldilineaceae bacterium]|jgi:hypothetical protein|nr:hypothetical protein [Caldilineaceae bacterium]